MHVRHKSAPSVCTTLVQAWHCLHMLSEADIEVACSHHCTAARRRLHQNRHDVWPQHMQALALAACKLTRQTHTHKSTRHVAAVHAWFSWSSPLAACSGAVHNQPPHHACTHARAQHSSAAPSPNEACDISPKAPQKVQSTYSNRQCKFPALLKLLHFKALYMDFCRPQKWPDGLNDHLSKSCMDFCQVLCAVAGCRRTDS